MNRVTEEHKAFKQAVDQLYDVFAKYPLRPDTEMCDCCHEPETEQRLHARPLRELSAEDLEAYSWSALLTWGNEVDFKHFLPRLFEIIPDADTPGWADTAVIFAKLHYANWREWPEVEQTAVEHYLSALWIYCITSADDAYVIDDVLCGIAHAVNNMAPYLNSWTASGMVGLNRLAQFIIHEAQSLAKNGKLSNSFWRDRKDPANGFGHDRTAQMNQVIEWLLSPDVRELLELTYCDHPLNPLARDIATAVDSLDYLISLHSAKKDPNETNQP